MKTSVFITLFNTRTKPLKQVTEEAIIDIIKNLIKPIDYIPYQKKIDLIESVIESVRGQRYETPMRYRQLIIATINAYTNLEVTVDDYDILCMNGLLNPILLTFKSEYVICESIMKMMVDDIFINDGR